MNKFDLGVVFLACFLIEKSCGQLLEQRLMSYKRCWTDAECPNENSFCFGNDRDTPGRCKCTDGYELLFRNRTHYACLKFSGWDQPCEIDTQCQNMGALSKCDGTCKCIEGTHLYTNGRCYQTALLDEYCTVDANCRLLDGSFGYCAYGKCVCQAGQKPSSDKLSCIKSRNIGDSCDNSEECNIEHSVCKDVCRCQIDYVISRNRSMCLKAATYFFQPCIEDDQCSEFLRNSVCLNGNCTCPEGMHGFENNCVRSAGLGEACIGFEDCVPERRFTSIVNCTEGICQCQPGANDERFGCNSGVRLKIDISSSVFIILAYLFVKLKNQINFSN